MSLRVAIVVADAPVPMWIATLVRRLTSAAFDVRLFLDPAARAQPKPAVYRAYEWLDARAFREGHDALAPEHDLAVLPLATLDEADVAVHLGATDPAELAGVTRYGAWTLAQSDLFWDMYNGTTYRTTLAAHLAGGERRVLYESRGRTDRASLQRSRNQAYWKATGAIVRALRQLQSRGPAYLESRPQQRDAQTPHDEPPRSATVLRHAAKAWLGVPARRLRKLGWREEWFVAARPVGADDGFRRVDAGAAADLADPFAVEHNGETYVFFEQLNHGSLRASIACARLDDGARAAGPAVTVLAPGYHVSYPFVFRRDGSVYMIPESLANGSVDLWRASDFPSRWVLEAHLLTDIRAVDATLLEEGSRLWLFLNAAEPGASINDELHLYTSSALHGPWVPHPENPVVSDVGRARPAGRIFRRDGSLIRPSQDCSSGYGRAVVLNRIDALTPSQYRETPIARIEPDWAPGLLGTHTYNSTERFEVVDGFRFARRW